MRTIKYLIILLLMAVPVMAEDAIIGDSSASTDTYREVEDSLIGSWFVSPASGDIDSIKVYVYNFNQDPDWQAYVYTYPDKSLLGSSDKGPIGAGTAGWKTLAFTTKPSILENDSVMLTISTDGNVLDRIYGETAANDTIFQDPHVFGTPPETFTPTDTITGYHIMICAYLTVSENGQVIMIMGD